MAKVIRSDAVKSSPSPNQVARLLFLRQLEKLANAVMLPHAALKTGQLDPLFIIDWSNIDYPVLRIFANANPPKGDKPVMITQRELFAKYQAYGYIEYPEGETTGEFKFVRKVKDSRALYCGTLMLELSMGGEGWLDPRLPKEVVDRAFAIYRRNVRKEQRGNKKATKPKGNGNGD